MLANDSVRLADGREIALRPGGPADVAGITRLYLGLSAESFRRRFHCARPAVAVVERFAALPAETGCVIAAPCTQPGDVVAEGRYVPADAETAELALAMRDEYQGSGLGRALLAELVRRAGQTGLKRLSGDVFLGNAPMLRLMRRYGCAVTMPADDLNEICLEISVTGGMPGWSAGTAGRRVLVEQHGWMDTRAVAALRAAGKEIRRCPGPLREAGVDCALLASGECRLAADADQIIYLLPADDPDCAAVLAAHQRRWPHRLAR